MDERRARAILLEWLKFMTEGRSQFPGEVGVGAFHGTQEKKPYGRYFWFEATYPHGYFFVYESGYIEDDSGHFQFPGSTWQVSQEILSSV